jgi:hypothetical protein
MIDRHIPLPEEPPLPDRKNPHYTHMDMHDPHRRHLGSPSYGFLHCCVDLAALISFFGPRALFRLSAKAATRTSNFLREIPISKMIPAPMQEKLAYRRVRRNWRAAMKAG